MDIWQKSKSYTTINNSSKNQKEFDQSLANMKFMKWYKKKMHLNSEIKL
jgi:hypothetical protein